jgi:large subunit ribosomal protein L27Ae
MFLKKPNKKDQSVMIDVIKYGNHKVLVKGEFPKIRLVIKAKFFSAKAEKIIKAVGVACVLTAYNYFNHI